MTDQELMEQFERATLPLECFRHSQHVRVAFLYLTQHPVLEALQAFSGALQRFACTHGRSELYHETITWAYVLLINDRINRRPYESWEDFRNVNSDLLDWKNSILKTYYSEETLRSELARKIFVFPDRHSIY